MFALAIAKALFEKHGDALKQRDDELGKITEKYSFEELASCCGVKSQIVLKIAEMMAQAGPKVRGPLWERHSGSTQWRTDRTTNYDIEFNGWINAGFRWITEP